MKKTFTLFLFLSSLHSHSQNFAWAKKTGSSFVDVANGIAIDTSKNLYTTGYFGNTADFDPGPGVYTLTPLFGGQPDIFISKLDGNGNFVWAKQLGGGSNDAGNSIAVDIAGNVYSTGFFQNPVPDFDPGPSTYTLPNAGATDVFVSKLDINGNFVWARGFGGISGDVGNSIAVDKAGNIYVAGTFSGTADFDPSAATYTLSSFGNNDIFILKLNSSGNFVWAKQIGGSNADNVESITTTTSSVYFTGNFMGKADFDPGPGLDTLTAWGMNDIFISKFDTLGNEVWTKRIGDFSNDMAFEIKTDFKGDVLTIGYYTGTVDFDPGIINYTITASGGSADAFVEKLDSLGNFVWVKSFGGTSGELGSCITTNSIGDIFIAGGFTSASADFDPGPGTYTLSSTVGTYDIFTCKLNSAGNFNWAIKIGGGNTDLPNGIVIDANSDVYTAGQFAVTVDFDPGPPLYFLIANAGDFYVNKLSSCALPPSVTNITNTVNLVICENNTTTLSVTGAGTPKWYTSSTSTTAVGSGTNYITPILSAGNYTYFAEDYTCGASVNRIPITVTVNPLPLVGALSSSTLLCSGQTATLTANGAATYSWNTSATTTTIVVSPTITTSYTVTGTNANGCSKNSVITQSVSACTNINSFANSNTEKIILFPNPTTDKLIIKSWIPLDLKVELVNSIGEIVYTGRLQNGKLEVEMKDFSNGIYFVQLDRKSTRLNSSHSDRSRMPSSA